MHLSIHFWFAQFKFVKMNQFFSFRTDPRNHCAQSQSNAMYIASLGRFVCVFRLNQKQILIVRVCVKQQQLQQKTIYTNQNNNNNNELNKQSIKLKITKSKYKYKIIHHLEKEIKMTNPKKSNNLLENNKCFPWLPWTRQHWHRCICAKRNWCSSGCVIPVQPCWKCTSQTSNSTKTIRLNWSNGFQIFGKYIEQHIRQIHLILNASSSIQLHLKTDRQTSFAQLDLVSGE